MGVRVFFFFFFFFYFSFKVTKIFLNPIYNEPETDENNIYSEIPDNAEEAGASDPNVINYLRTFKPEYEQLPGRCGADGKYVLQNVLKKTRIQKEFRHGQLAIQILTLSLRRLTVTAQC